MLVERQPINAPQESRIYMIIRKLSVLYRGKEYLVARLVAVLDDISILSARRSCASLTYEIELVMFIHLHGFTKFELFIFVET